MRQPYKSVGLSALFLALCSCAQPSALEVHGVGASRADDEDHPATLRDVADGTQPVTVGAIVNAAFSFPGQASK